MKVYEIRDGFGIDNLKIAERAEPNAGDNQILIRVRAVSLNYRDLLVTNGVFDPKLQLPRVPVSDGAGEVVSVGANVKSFKPGDRVAATFFQGWQTGDFDEAFHKTALGGSIDGMLAEYVALDQSGAIRIPDELSFEAAACLPCAGLTAWHALFENNPIKSGDTVLALGTGGVSLFALQFASAAGATVIITSSSDEKLERAKELGAHHGINYRTNANWGEAVRELTDGRGVDHTIETGGAGTLDQSVQAARTGGTISLLGVLTGFTGEVNAYNVFHKMLRINGVYVGSRAMFERMNRAISICSIKPVIDQVYEFDQAPNALRRLAAGAHFGKLVVRV